MVTIGLVKSVLPTFMGIRVTGVPAYLLKDSSKSKGYDCAVQTDNLRSC